MSINSLTLRRTQKLHIVPGPGKRLKNIVSKFPTLVPMDLKTLRLRTVSRYNDGTSKIFLVL